MWFVVLIRIHIYIIGMMLMYIYISIWILIRESWSYISGHYLFSFPDMIIPVVPGFPLSRIVPDPVQHHTHTW